MLGSFVLTMLPTIGLYPNLEGGNFCEIAPVCRLFCVFVCFSTPRAYQPLHLSTQKEEEEEDKPTSTKITFDQSFLEIW